MNNHKLFYTAILITSAICLSLNASERMGLQNPEKSVVLIRSVKQDFDYESPWKRGDMTQTSGSGFIIAGERILTNAHNISNSRYVELRKENIARRYMARIVFAGHDCDLAILTVDDKSFFQGTTALELAGIPNVNSKVSTYGFPVGGDRISVTEGIVSRIEFDSYAHTAADAHLVIQTDAAINPGNSGGPVIQDNKVVGVAFQGLREAENIGYMIPTTVIKHFLKDIEDGKYDGFGSLGAVFYPGLHNDGYRDYLKVPQNYDGVVVVSTMLNSSVEMILKPGDVLTRIDEYNIDNDGMIEIYGLRLTISEVLESKQIGENVQLTFYRDGNLNRATATIALNRPVFEPAKQYDKPPRYVCFAGLVFVPATRNFLETWGPRWPQDIPFYLRYLFTYSMDLNKDRELKEYVILSTILPDEVNAYAYEFNKQIVESINDRKINSLKDLYLAFKQTDEPFYTIRFKGSDNVLRIDAEEAQNRHKMIIDKYNIPAEAQLEAEL